MFNESEIDWSYYDISQVKDRVLEDEPVFTLRATDYFAPEIVRAYGTMIVQHPTADEELFKKGIAALIFSKKMSDWQLANPHLVKMPDMPEHKEVKV